MFVPRTITVVALVFALVWSPILNAAMSAASQVPAPSGPLKVVIIDGDEAANVVQEKMAAEPVIEVRDDQDRKVAGAVVRFKIRRAVSKRLSAAFRGGQDEVRTLTDPAGQARAGTLTPLEPGPYEIDVEVTHRGQTALATLRHRNYATAADARADGRQPVQRATIAAGAAGAAGVAGTGGNGGTAGAAGAAAAAGGGLSKMAIAGIAAGGAAGVGAIALLAGGGKDSPTTPTTPTAPAAPPGRVTGVTASVSSGLMAATSFAFSAQTADFVAGALTYRWDFGDSTTSSEASPTKVYAAAGTYTVAVTVSDTRQSARSEMSVNVYSLTGRWINPSSGTSYVFTQTGSALTGTTTGTVSTATPPWTFTNCPLSGSVRGSTPMVAFNRPECRNGASGGQFLFAGDFRLDLAAGGQTLNGETTQPAPFGTQSITLQRQ
jgi:hypothetical protein